MRDLTLLSKSRELLDRSDDPTVRHLTSPLSLREYARFADQITQLVRGNRILDWGCGYGHMSYLLARRNLAVTSYDISPTVEDRRLPVTRGLRAVRGGHPQWLPFRDAAFDAVLSCGVLEHVDDVDSSIEEIARVLVPGGQFFVYNLPQRWSYKELVIERLNLGYTHESRYAASSIRALLAQHGFRVRSVRRSGFLPHMATGLPPRARRLYYRASSTLFHIDRMLSRTPIVNRVAQSLEVVAQKSLRDGSRVDDSG